MTVAAGKRTAAVATLAALTLVLALLASMMPAGAQSEGGAGVVTGTQLPAAQATQNPPVPPSVPLFCAQVNPSDGDLLFDLEGEGTYTGLTQGSSPPAVYRTANAAPLDIQVKATGNTGPYYIAPEGTYTQNQCEAALPNQAGVAGAQGIPVEITVEASSNVQDSTGDACNGSGTFRRMDSTVVFEWDLTENCQVNGNVAGGTGTAPGVAPDQTQHTIEGHMTPCFTDPITGAINTCGSPQNQVQVVGSYQQTLH